MGWRGNIPEFFCTASKRENFPIDKDTTNTTSKKGEEKSPPNLPKPGGLFSSPFFGRRRGALSPWRLVSIGDRVRRGERQRQSKVSNCRAVAAQSRKSASGSRVVERRGGGERSRRCQSLRCRRIFSMTHGFSMKLSIRKWPPHFGQVKGSAR
jgi:hypothetical protein